MRFEYVTDDAVNGPGLLLDNFAIPEIGYTDDAEAGAAGWESSGWVQTDNSLAQRWLVQIMEIGVGQVTVQRMVVGPDGLGQIAVSDTGQPAGGDAGDFGPDAGDDRARQLQLLDHAAIVDRSRLTLVCVVRSGDFSRSRRTQND